MTTVLPHVVLQDNTREREGRVKKGQGLVRIGWNGSHWDVDRSTVDLLGGSRELANGLYTLEP
jgi:hypothetical protein